MYVARWTANPHLDIDRGWSAYQGFMEDDLESALEMAGFTMPDDEELEEVQARWVRTYGDHYEDWDTFRQEWLEEKAEEYDLRQDPHFGTWRPFHHDGLSCYVLQAGSVFGAMIEAKMGGAGDGSGFGYATVGKVEVVAKVCHLIEDSSYALYIFECDDVEVEV